jgi:hypothetical protein
MDPVVVRREPPYTRGALGRHQSRLKTLLHKPVHSFFNKYACKLCPASGVNENHAGGHGRAFVMVMTAVEQAVDRLLRQKIHAQTFVDWRCSWKDVKYLPSMHDLEEWK